MSAQSAQSSTRPSVSMADVTCFLFYRNKQNQTPNHCEPVGYNINKKKNLVRRFGRNEHIFITNLKKERKSLMSFKSAHLHALK